MGTPQYLGRKTVGFEGKCGKNVEIGVNDRPYLPPQYFG